MGTIIASAILAKASAALNDVAQVRWTQAELLGYLNDGQRAAAALKPACSTETMDVTLATDKTQQRIPESALALLEPLRNLGGNGTTTGRPITVTDRASLDGVIPTWHSDANTLGYIQHVVQSTDPRTFYVFPKAPATAWHIEAVFAVAPADVAMGAPIAIDDIYAPALESYVLHKAYAKNRSDVASAALSDSLHAKFVAGMGAA